MSVFISLFTIALNAILAENFILVKFMGICPFMGVSKKQDTALGMGIAVTFVMGIASAATWAVNEFLLVPLNLVYMQTVVFILVIAALVQLVEMFLQKAVPALYQALGIYLPLITTNCAVLGVALLNIQDGYNFVESLVYGITGGIGFTVATSFTDWDGISSEMDFIGLKNYQDLLKDDTFWLALQNTVFYAVVGVPLVIIFSIFLAHQINKKIRGRTIYRTLLFIPAITIPAAIGILWRWILNYQYGIFNWILEKLGFSRISWLGDVKYVRWAIILVVVWSMVSYYVIIMLAAMQGIDSSYYEAARLDGASSRQVFFKITLPMLTPMIFFSVIMVTIGILQIFDFIYLMVDRQTLSYTYSMSLVTYFYECAFNKSSMRGYGAAISVVLAAIIMVITMIQMVGKKYWVRSGE